jgi:23S rRNA U2552 (ribose-2'-O)-methylase RlmE/FtsJ
MKRYKVGDDLPSCDDDAARPRSRLSDAKHRIDCNHVQWDALKRSSNPYELVSHPGVVRVTNVRPVSRSFFKMWELLQEFPQLRACLSGRVASAAEGPGGFVQAMMKAGAHDLHAITLVNRCAPGMRISDPRLKIHTVDGSGDICRKHVVRAFVHAVGEVSLFTADGGFDVAGRFDKQEEISSDLIQSEIAMGLACLQEGGCLVVKVYDMFLPSTRTLAAVLYECFESMYVCKPCTSRPANSERYLVCISRLVCTLHDRVSEHVRRGATPFPTATPAVRESLEGSLDAICDAMACTQLDHINTAFDTASDAKQDMHAQRWCDAYGEDVCRTLL